MHPQAHPHLDLWRRLQRTLWQHRRCTQPEISPGVRLLSVAWLGPVVITSHQNVKTARQHKWGSLLPNPERALMVVIPIRGVGAPHQCPRVDQERSGEGERERQSCHWPATGQGLRPTVAAARADCRTFC